MRANLNRLDLSRRKVVCVNNEFSPELEQGNEYTLVWINVYPEKCHVILAEYPEESFNSVSFAEVDGYQKPNNEPPVHEVMKLRRLSGYSAPELFALPYAKMQAYLEAAGRALKMIFEGDELPELRFTDTGVVVNLAKFKSEIDNLKEGEMFTVGRKSAAVNVKLLHPLISRIQAYVVKNRLSGFYEVYDVSLNGTTVTEPHENKGIESAGAQSAHINTLEQYVAEKRRSVRVIFLGAKLPKLNCAGEKIVDLAQYQGKIDSLKEDEAFVIGRDNSIVKVDVAIDNSFVSRVQAWVVKTSSGYEICDVSVNGTSITE